MRRLTPWLNGLVWLGVAAPLLYLTWRLWMDRLGANPIQEITHQTGRWTLRFLLATLAITPLRRLTGWNGWIRWRRRLGLAAFFYASIHLLLYLWLDQFFDWGEIGRDILKRRFITVGLLAYGLMVPLAVTSTAGWIRRLGGRTWRRLHRLVYAIAVLGVLHYWWAVKFDWRPPLAYGLILLALFLLRLRRTTRVGRAASTVPPRRTAAPVGDPTD